MRSKALHSVIILSMAGAAFAADPLVGTWKLNVAKSNYPAPQPKGAIVLIRERGDNLFVSVTGTQADGKPYSMKYVEPKNGGPIDYVEGGLPRGVFAVSKRIDDHTREDTASKGDVSLTARFVVSKDGKTLTITRKSVNQPGPPVNRVEIWERQ